MDFYFLFPEWGLHCVMTWYIHIYVFIPFQVLWAAAFKADFSTSAQGLGVFSFPLLH